MRTEGSWIVLLYSKIYQAHSSLMLDYYIFYIKKHMYNVISFKEKV